MIETRKQREIRSREAEILRVARSQVLAGGYLGLNIDRIAQEIEYSKGTVYQHFSNKEDILLALANQALSQRTELFEKAARRPGQSRLRMAAVGAAVELFVENYSEFFVVEQIIRASSLWEKTSEDRRTYMRQCENRCMSIVSGIVRDGLAHGDLELQADQPAEDVVFGLWSMSWGAHTIMHSSDSLSEIGLGNPALTLRLNMSRLLDGYGWGPLSGDFDYLSFMNEAKQELSNG